MKRNIPQYLLPRRLFVAALIVVASQAASRVAYAQASDDPFASWKTTRVDEGAFEIAFPDVPQSEAMPEEADARTARGRTFTYESRDKTMVLMAQYLDLPPGEFIVMPSYLSELVDSAAMAMGGKIDVVDSTLIDGRFARRFRGTIRGALPLSGQVVLRGNRMHMTLAIHAKPTDGTKVAHFHRSLRFTEHRRSPWIDVSLADHGYEMRMPSFPNLDDDTLYDGTIIRNVVARDNNSGQSYVAATYEFTEYYAASNLDTHMLQLISETPEMRIVSDSVFTISGSPARKVLVARGPDSLQQRFLFVSRGRRLTMLTTIDGYGEKPRSNDEFLSSFAFVGDTLRGDVLESKVAKLVADLNSTDSATHRKGLRAISSVSVSSADVPLLLDAVTRTYPEYDDVFLRPNASIVHLIESTGDPADIAKLVPLFDSLPPDAQSAMLNVLIDEPEDESVAMFADLLTKADKKAWPRLSFYGFDEEHRGLLKLLLPRFYGMLDSAFAHEVILDLTSRALRLEVFDNDDLSEYRGRILNAIRLALVPDPTDSSYARYRLVNSAIEVLVRLDPKEDVIALLQTASRDTVGYSAFTALERLLVIDAPVAADVAERFAASIHYRVKFYELCAKHDRLTLFPTAYRSQESFASATAYSYLYEYMDGEIEESQLVDQLELEATRIVEFNGERGRAFLYTVKGSLEGYPRAVLVGLLPEDDSKVETTFKLLQHSDQPVDVESLDEVFETLVAEAEAERIQMEQWNAQRRDDD